MAGDRDSLLTSLYGEATGSRTAGRLERRLAAFRTRHPQVSARPATTFSERDVIAITYGDLIREPEVAPLQSLAEFAEAHLRDVVTGIHVLPFHPYSSDDGFAVIDYRAVDPELGDWSDIDRLGRRFGMMFDAVVNHVSVESRWFHGFLEDEEPYTRFFVTADERSDVSAVVRPRLHPVLTAFQTRSGERRVWTTFSDDQVDLNFRYPDVLLEVVDVLLNYVAHGAVLIRLDAIAYLWKREGTSCIHLPETHMVIQLFRSVLDEVAPQVALVTETNVAHPENISYFGDGSDEAQLVYNFALPVLTLDAFARGTTGKLAEWANGLATPSDRTAFLNFLASHDGIGVNAGRGIISERRITALAKRTAGHGGFVSERRNPDGSRSAYELNINLFDALSAPNGGEPMDLQVRKFATAHAIQLALAGVPAVYLHSLLGSRGWPEGVAQTGRPRTINRQKLQRATLESELSDPDSLRHAVFDGFRRLIKARASSPVFSPHAGQEVASVSDAVLVIRRSAEGSRPVSCLHNLSADTRTVQLAVPRDVRDMITGRQWEVHDGTLDLGPYETVWLEHA